MIQNLFPYLLICVLLLLIIAQDRTHARERQDLYRMIKADTLTEFESSRKPKPKPKGFNWLERKVKEGWKNVMEQQRMMQQ